MRRSLLFLLITVALFTDLPAPGTALAESETPEQLIAELRGEAPAPPRSAAQLRQAYTQVLAWLLPEMGSADLANQKAPQQTWQAICWRAGRPGAETERQAACAAMVAALRKATTSAGPGAPSVIAQKWLVKQLEYIGGAESADVLGQLLESADADVAEGARRALAHNPSPEAADILRQALLRAATPAGKTAFLNALAMHHRAADADVFRKYAAAEADEVRVAAVQALATVGDRRDIPLVAAARRKGSPRARRAATDAYLRLADAVATADRSAALRMYKQLLSAPADIRCAALLGIGQVGGPAELPVLLGALSEPEATVRGAARMALGSLPSQQVNAAIAEKMKTASADLKVTLIEALAEGKSPRSLPLLMQAAKDPDVVVRVTALRGLGELAVGTAAPVLVRALVHGAGQEQEAAQEALARVPGDRVVTEVERALKTAPVSARQRLVRALSSRPSDHARSVLKHAATDPEATVRAEALIVLARFAQPADVSFVLTRLTSTTDEQERAACQAALEAICRRPPVRKALEDELTARYRSGAKDVRLALLPVCALVGGEKALTLVREAWRGTDPELNEAALHALVAWPDATAADDLLAVVEHGTTLRQRKLALRGYVQLVGAPGAFPPNAALERFLAVLKVAPDAADRKLVLAGVGGLKTTEALTTVERYLTDNELGLDAATAALRIADSIRWQAPEAAVSAVKQVRATTGDPDVRKRADALLSDIDRYEGHVKAWVYSGPWKKKDAGRKQLFDAVFPPETKEDTTGTWRQALLSEKLEKSWAVDFNRMDRGDNRAGYIRTWIWSPADMNARLEIGSDDSVKAWLDGKLVDAFDGPRGLAPAQEQVAVSLRAGWNPLLLKVVNGGGDWEGAARLRRPDGRPLTGVAVMGKPGFLAALKKAFAAPNPDPQLAQVTLDLLTAAPMPDPQGEALLRAAARLAPNGDVKDKLAALLAEYTKYEDCIVNWQVAGPYVAEGKDGNALFDEALPPESPAEKEVEWKPVQADSHGIVWLEKLFGGDNRAAYLRCWVMSPKEQPARLELGSDDGVKVWLNGTLVHAHNVARAVAPGQDKVPVTLTKGVNSLLMKVTNLGGHWAAWARVRAPDGSHLDGVTVSAEKPRQQAP